MKNYLKVYLPVLLMICIANFVQAQGDQNQITISRPAATFGMKPVPVSLEGFSGEVAEVLKFDLYVQGFSFVAPADAQYQISGNNSGNVTGSVSDKFAKKIILSRSYTGASLRSEAHAFANEIVEAITGKPGISQLRGSTAKIAFKAQPSGNGAGEIYVSDFDGHNAQAVTRDNSIVAAPSWVSGRLALCYNSYSYHDDPDIFYQDLTTGQRKLIARYGGSNISPSVSPDGTKFAFISSKGGSPNIYVANIDGTGLRQLTTGVEDSSPCWSPDGKWICFAAKIASRRVLAKVPVSGGAVQKISTAGVANPTEPDWSPDGKWIAFTSQMGDFNICVVPSDGSATPVVLVTGEDPSWAPNSRTLIFAKRSSGYRYGLSVLDVFTKQVKDVGRISGSDSEPAWAK
jgi:TolB protein